ncbi:hypothetical protein [Baekduia sp. Peel2402]|uniref:hypothetical protein n=1 Tax=Baekduia sp. Peel2402 TaxID=3458296 RepID=UPI00403EDB72
MRARFAVLAGVALTSWCSVVPMASGASVTNTYGYSQQQFSVGSSNVFTGEMFSSLAVDATTGNILATRQDQTRVEVYAPDPLVGGTALAGFAPGVFPANIAVDPSDGATYVHDSLFDPGTIYRWVTDGQPIPTYTQDGAFVSPVVPSGAIGSMAVDPVTHDLLVADRGANQVLRFSSTTGSLLDSFDGSDILGGTAAGPFTGVASIAVGPSGTVYVSDTGRKAVDRFDGTGTWLGSVALAAGDSPGPVATNPSTGDVAIVLTRGSRRYLGGFTAAGARLWEARISFDTGGSTLSGLAWDGSASRLYLGTAEGTVSPFVPAIQPGTDAPTISNPRHDLVHAAAEVAPAGQTTSARLEYCRATAACDDFPVSNDGNPANPWVRAPDQALSAGVPVTIEDDLPLDSNATWRIRVSANSTMANGAVTESTSASVSFFNPLAAPVVVTGDAGSITATAAELTGTIDTIGGQTTYHFEYGTTSDYGQRVPVDGEGTAGAVRGSRPVSRVISGLVPGATYHYRLVARNAAGESSGADRTFTTPTEIPSARHYEQVTPTDKKGGSINSLLGVHAAEDGSAVSYVLTAAPSDAPSAVLLARYLSRRTNTDWLRWEPVDPPLNVSRLVTESVTQAISRDFSHAMVISNRALAPGAMDGGGNVYIEDLRSRSYTLVGSAPGISAYFDMSSPQTENMYLAGAADFSWITFLSPRSLLPGAPAQALYRWSAAEGLTLQSVGTDSVQRPGASVELTSRWVSDNGDIMYYNLATGQGDVRRHVLGGATTTISVAHAGGLNAPGTPAGGKLDGISRDGRFAFFRTQTRLSAAGPSSPGGNAYLYRYDAQSDDVEYLGMAADAGNGTVLAVGDDGRTVYFDDGAGTSVWRDGSARQFTTSQPARGSFGGNGYLVFGSPNGRYLGYIDPTDITAHLYDAVSEIDVCVSCMAGGGGRDAGTPGGTRTVSNRTPQVVTDSGIMFFDTAARLLSADRNGTRDVYSYQHGTLRLISPGEGSYTARFADATPEGDDVYFTTDQGLVGQDTDQSVDLYDARLGDGFPPPGQSPSGTAACARNECGEAQPGPVESPVPTAPQDPTGPSSKSPAPARTRLSVDRVTIGSRSMTIRFRASERGRVQVRGTRVVETVRNVAKAGTYSITVPLSRKARSLRASHRRFAVSVKITLTGGWGASSAKVSRTLGKK